MPDFTTFCVPSWAVDNYGVTFAMGMTFGAIVVLTWAGFRWLRAMSDDGRAE